MALASYHANVLGVMTGYYRKGNALRAKAAEFMTRDFGTGLPETKLGPGVQTDLEKRIALLEQSNSA